jgi:DNA-binding CsgD family transcriptional regulator
MTVDDHGRADIAVHNPVLPSANEGVIVIDKHFKLLGIDGGAETILKRVAGGNFNLETTTLPTNIRGLAGSWPPTGDTSVTGFVTLGNVGYRCCIFQVQPLNGVIDQTVFALHLKRAGSISGSLSSVIETYHLTDREGEVLQGISLGLTSKVLAARMNISPNTVNAFLRMIMIKLGVNTRAGLVGKLLEDNSPQDSQPTHIARKGGRNV